jgi:hypothetical protein
MNVWAVPAAMKRRHRSAHKNSLTVFTSIEREVRNSIRQSLRTISRPDQKELKINQRAFLWSAAAALAACLLGAGGMYYLSGIVSTYGADARLIADATMDTEVLERLSSGRGEEAKTIVQMRLHNSMRALKIVEDDLTQEQRDIYQGLITRTQAVLSDYPDR